MNGKTGRFVVACCVLFAVAGGVAFMILRTGGVRAAPQALADVGRLRVGSALGEERAGFSGRPKVLVFTSATDPQWSAIQACLLSLSAEAELSSFTPVLVDETLDADEERVLRERDGLRVVVRGLNGKFWGGLPAGFRCEELLALLHSIRTEMIQLPEKSPIYARLLESTEPIDWLIQEGQLARAQKFVEFLAEFEGTGSPACTAAQARLPR
jgi:hypothetical protein